MRFTNFLQDPDNIKHPATSKALPVQKQWGHGTVRARYIWNNETLVQVSFFSQKSDGETQSKSLALIYKHVLLGGQDGGCRVEGEGLP